MRFSDLTLRNNVFVAPMAGVTDRPFRQLCKTLGAGYAVAEMAASNPQLWLTEKTSRRLNHDGEMEPKAVQIAGSDPELMVEAALHNLDCGAQVIDINMGCPAKKVCHVAAGSALLQDEALVARLLERVVSAVSAASRVPVTLKYRTGWSPETRNAVRIARLAEACGVSLLTLHGRTRCDFFQGAAEYESIAAVKAAVRLPVVANGDIDSPRKARQVLEYTRADAVMIGRAAQGRPWIFREIAHFLATGAELAPPGTGEIGRVLHQHLLDHYAFYGELIGLRTARKHIGWYVRGLPGGEAFRQHMNTLESCEQQLGAVDRYFAELGARHARLPDSNIEERLAA